MSSINKAIVMGRLGKDPELRTTNSGKQWATVSLATSESWGKGDDRKEKTIWHNIVVWVEPTARYLCDYARKGSLVYVEGQIEIRQWDKDDGTKGYSLEIVVNPYKGELKILRDGKNKDESSGGGGGDRNYSDESGSSPAVPVDEIPF